MPLPWSKPLDIEKLADGAEEVEFELPLAQLPRLRAQHPSAEGTVQGRVRFGRESGFIVAMLSMSGAATLDCQRCLKPLVEPVSGASRIALIGSESEAVRVPENLEPVLAAGGRISIAELVEEEMLLELPIVPLHRQPGECVVADGVPAPVGTEPELTTQKPFAQLANLLKR